MENKDEIIEVEVTDEKLNAPKRASQRRLWMIILLRFVSMVL